MTQVVIIKEYRTVEKLSLIFVRVYLLRCGSYCSRQSGSTILLAARELKVRDGYTFNLEYYDLVILCDSLDGGANGTIALTAGIDLPGQKLTVASKELMGIHIRSKETKNHAQFTSDIADDRKDGDDTLHTLQGQCLDLDYPPICYYCGDDYKPDSKDHYEQHVVTKHGKPAYPNKAEIERLGLEAQGKSWEK